MTDDIVARLRDWAECEDDILIEAACADFHVAADEIERLKNQIFHIIEHNNPQIKNANSYFKLLEEELARCNKIIDDYEEEHSRLRAALEKIAQHDMQAIALDALRLNPVRTRPAKEASDDPD